MKRAQRKLGYCVLAVALLTTQAAGQGSSAAPADDLKRYVLGRDDELIVRAADVEEFDGKPTRIDIRGNILVPFLGNLRAAGLTPEELEGKLTKELGKYLTDPQVSVTVVEYRSQPVSVVGAVNKPGVYYLTGHDSLVQILSAAGGLNKDVAGNTVQLTRRKAWGKIPLPSAKEDPTGQFTTATVYIGALLKAKTPETDIPLKPSDVISVPRAELVYVMGAVRRPGGFMLTEREDISVLQALSMAEGLDRGAVAGRGKILRELGNGKREELAVDIKKVLDGRNADIRLQPNDILFIPSNSVRNATLRGVEAAIQLGTGIAIYRR